jgi:hypothetical protein
MAVKIITFLLILGTNVAVGAGFFFLLMLGLNGFSERAANYAFGIFIGGGILVSLLTAAAGVWLVGFLIAKKWNQFLAALAAIAGFAALGFLIKVVIFFTAIFAADFFRTHGKL